MGTWIWQQMNPNNKRWESEARKKQPVWDMLVEDKQFAPVVKLVRSAEPEG